jgi:hypothetical protein
VSAFAADPATALEKMGHRLSEQFASRRKMGLHSAESASSMIVVKERNHPPQDWKMTLVEEIHPGRDGLVRVGTTKTTAGFTKRPIHKLVILPTGVKFQWFYLSSKFDGGSVLGICLCLEAT